MMIKAVNCLLFVYLLFAMYEGLQSCECTNPTGEVNCTVLESKQVADCSKTLTNNLPIKPFIFLKSISTMYIKLNPVPFVRFKINIAFILKDTPAILSWELRFDRHNFINDEKFKKLQHCGKLQIDSGDFKSKNNEIEIKLSDGCVPSLQSFNYKPNGAGDTLEKYELILRTETERVVSYTVLIPVGPSILDESYWSPSIAICNQPMENGSMYLVFSKAKPKFGISMYDVTISANNAILKDIKNTNETLITFTNNHGSLCKAKISSVNCTHCLEPEISFYCVSTKKVFVNSWWYTVIIVVVVVVAIVLIATFIAYKFIGTRIIVFPCEKPSVLLIMSYDCQKHEETVDNLAYFLEYFCTVEFDKRKPQDMQLIHWITEKQKTCKYFIVVGSQGAWDKGINNVDRIEQESHNRLRDPFKIILPIISEDFSKAIHNNENLQRFVGVSFDYSSSFGLPLPLKYKFLLPDNWKALIYHLFQLSPATGKLLRGIDNNETMTRLDKLKQSIKSTETFMKENPNWYTEICCKVKQSITEKSLPSKEEEKIDTLSAFGSSESLEEMNNFDRLSSKSLADEFDSDCANFPKSLSSLSLASQCLMEEETQFIPETGAIFV